MCFYYNLKVKSKARSLHYYYWISLYKLGFTTSIYWDLCESFCRLANLLFFVTPALHKNTPWLFSHLGHWKNALSFVLHNPCFIPKCGIPRFSTCNKSLTLDVISLSLSCRYCLKGRYQWDLVTVQREPQVDIYCQRPLSWHPHLHFYKGQLLSPATPAATFSFRVTVSRA